MKSLAKYATVSALALMIAAPAFAQTGVVGIDTLDDRIDDIQEDVAEDLAEGEDDDMRFDNNRFAQGWSGSFALGGSYNSGTLESGDDQTGDIIFAGRLRYGAGDWNHTFGIAGAYSESDGEADTNQIYGIYDGNRYFTEQFYLFVMAYASYDEFDTNKVNSFLGFGPGYRVVNTADLTWRLQAGPGVRYVEDQFNNETTEVAGIAASRFYYRISPTAFVSMDTEVLFSDVDTTIVNDLGLTVKVTDRVGARFALLTNYNDSPAPGFKNTGNTLGVSLVWGF